MHTPLLGVHHVTAIVDDPQMNIDFYTEVLGLRLIKQTVNFDDPYTYHLYYGDQRGRPGTIVTFFSWPDGRRGSRGTGQISAITFAVPVGALPFWEARFGEYGFHFGGPEERFGMRMLSLYDPAGLLLELVEQPTHNTSDAPPGSAIQGLFGVTLTVADVDQSAAFLTNALGFQESGSEAGRSRYRVGEAAIVDLVGRPDVPRGEIAVGSVHHVAWRVADDDGLEAWRGALSRQGAEVTPVRERQYFRSIYFREPGGVLFEIATDAPGFAIDESPAALGQRLMLPPWLEPQRAEIEERLPPIRVPGT